MSTSTLNVRAFCKRNSSSQDLTDVTEPWLNTVPLPEFPDKADYRRWCANPGTDYCFFSMLEGEVPAMPIGNGNKPRRVHGIVGDYDAVVGDDAAFIAGLRRASNQYPPYAWNKTRSGGARVVWLFAEPMWFFNNATYKRFCARLKRELKAADLFPALDDHWDSTNIYFCAGADWTIHPQQIKISAAALHLWLSECSRGDDFDGTIEIPLDRVALEVEKKYPGRWAGPFTEGARGVRFWDPGADAKAAVVRKTGMQAFTGDEPFLSWERLFGRAFIDAYMQDRLGKAIEEMYFDGLRYYRQLPGEMWDGMDVSTARRHLLVHYKLNSTPPKGESESEVDRALHRIETTKRVGAALPFPHNHNQVVEFNRQRYLNTASARLCMPALDPQEWGENFPWVASYFSTLLATTEGLQAYMAWGHIFYKSCYDGDPRKGHAMFLVGPPGTGKTLLSTQIMARLVGGFAEATQYVVDGNQFNNALFEYALWTCDDAMPGSDPKAHARFSSMIKAAVANGTIRYNKKYGQSCDAPFNGRIMTSLNDDPNSLAILPDADASLLDKIILLRTGDVSADVADDLKERYATIDREMPYFARWLLDYEIPEWIDRDPRFGIFKHGYHEKTLLEDAKSVTTGSSILEAVDMWRAKYKEVHETETEWKGTPTELFAAMRDCAGVGHVIARLNPVWLGRHIQQAISNRVPWIGRGRRSTDKARVIVIKL